MSRTTYHRIGTVFYAGLDPAAVVEQWGDTWVVFEHDAGDLAPTASAEFDSYPTAIAYAASITRSH